MSDFEEEESFAVNYLNQSVQRHLTDLQGVLESFLKRSLTLDYEFKHAFTGSLMNEYAGSEYEEEDCSNDCYRNCSHFPLQQASMHSKQYVRLVKDILLGQILDIDVTALFGSAISLQFLDSLKLLQSDTQTIKDTLPKDEVIFSIIDAYPTLSMQSGGGSGWGFQMYCDGDLFMSSGAGGGGGFTLHAQNHTLCLGGGGGGGLQWYSVDSENITSLAWSLGGGGGCGLNDGYAHDIQCGFTTDVSNNTSANTSLEVYYSRLQQCNNLTIAGGGGGGGGTGACCWPFYIGYGYSFTMHVVPSNDAEIDQESDLLSNVQGIRKTGWDWWRKLWDNRNYHLRMGSSYHNDTVDSLSSPDSNSSDGNSSQDIRYSYDVVGYVLHEVAAKYCNHSFTDWCCVSSRSQQVISQCLISHSVLEPPTNASDKDNLLDCVFVLDHYEQINWLVDTPSPACGTASLQQRGVVNNSDTYKLTDAHIPNYFDALDNAENSSSDFSPPHYYSVYVNTNERVPHTTDMMEHFLMPECPDASSDCITFNAWKCVGSAADTDGSWSDTMLSAPNSEIEPVYSSFLLYSLVLSICLVATVVCMYLMPRRLLSFCFATRVESDHKSTASQTERVEETSSLLQNCEVLRYNNYNAIR